MKLEEFLLGPFAAESQDFWREWNISHPDQQVLYRNVVVAFKGKALKEIPGKLKDVVRCDEGKCTTCILHFDVVNKEWDVKGPVWALKDVTDMAATDALFDGLAHRCTERDLKPVIIDKIQIDIDLPEEHPSLKARDWWRGLSAFERAVKVAARIKHSLDKRGFDARFIYSGHRGFHVLVVPPQPVPAALRGSIIKALSDAVFKEAVPWLEVDTAALDPVRKLRIPGTVHTETGRYARTFDPETGDFTEFTWPKPLSKNDLSLLLFIYAERNPPEIRREPAAEMGVRKCWELRALTDAQINNLVELIKPIYKPGRRNPILFGTLCLMWRACIDAESARRFVEKLTDWAEKQYSDEDRKENFDVWRRVFSGGPDKRRWGAKKFVEVVTDAYRAIGVMSGAEEKAEELYRAVAEILGAKPRRESRRDAGFALGAT